MSPRMEPVTRPTTEQVEALTKVHDRAASINVFATMARNPRLLRRFNVLGGYFTAHGLLPARERELVVLRTAYRAGSEYEFGRHSLIASDGLLSVDEIRGLAQEQVDGRWPNQDAALIKMVDELMTSWNISDTTWARLKDRWDDASMIEVILLSGFYGMLAGFLNASEVELEDEVPGWPSGSPLASSSDTQPSAADDAG